MSEKTWGIKIWDASGYYLSEINVDQKIQHKRPTSSNELFNSKFPKHTHNGLPSYWTGSCSANFSDNKSGDCPEDYNFGEGNVKYVADFVEWLHNDLVKYLQLSEDFIIPVGILDTVTWDVESGNTVDDGYAITISFDWEQLAPAIIGGGTSG